MAEAAQAEQHGGGESTFTVIVAAVANLGIALAKAVAGVISGSSAMLSEAAHSVADMHRHTPAVRRLGPRPLPR